MGLDDVPLTDLETTRQTSRTTRGEKSHSTEALSSGAEGPDRSLATQEQQTPRRRPSAKRQLSRGAMSLVGLKNIFFQETKVKVKRSESRGLLNKSPRSSYGGTESDQEDIESQTSILSVPHEKESSARRSFKIDARVISDATIGLSDGLTVPFALTAGLSALGNTKVVIYGGFAELIAGAISMGLGGYLGAQSELASYQAQREEAEELCSKDPQQVRQDINEVFEPFRLPKSTLEDLTSHLIDSPRLVDFVMQFQHCAEEPAASRAFTSAITIAMGYFLGGLLPLIPYFFVDRVYDGLILSIAVMVFALFAFGYVKTCAVMGWTGARNVREACFGGIQMVVVGSVAAGAAMGLVRLFNDSGV